MKRSADFTRCTLFLLVFLLSLLCFNAAFAASVPAQLDTTHANEGYFRARYVGTSEKRLKVQVKHGGELYNYDLNRQGDWETFPLQLGDGQYKLTIFENVRNTSYAQLLTDTIDVALDSEFSPFLAASQRVNFSEHSLCVKKAAELCAALSTDVEKVDAIYQYVIDTYTYDKKKAQEALDGKLVGYVPDLDEIYRAKSGICYDYAALMAGMLRSQGIPTKLVTGYVAPDSLYHAWNEVYLEGQGWVTKAIYFDGEVWKLMDPTFASVRHNSSSILKFIGNVKNYSQKYCY